MARLLDSFPTSTRIGEASDAEDDMKNEIFNKFDGIAFRFYKPCYRGPGELKIQPSTYFKIIDNAEQRTNLLKLEACPSSPRLQLEPAFGHLFQS